MDTKKLRQKILDLAIHGKLVPQDPNDEPASVLLERIKAEKEDLIKEGKIKRSKKSAKTSDTPHYENVPFEVPEGWVWTIVGEVGEVITGSTPSKDIAEYYGGDIPFYKPTDLDLGINTNSASDTLTIEGYNLSRKLPVGSILVTCIGATIGKTGLISTEGACNQQINAIIPSSLITSTFLYYSCISEYFQKEIRNHASATTLPILNKNNFTKLPIPLPPLSEQQRIVKEIERWFALIEQIEQSKADLQTTIKQTKNKILNLAIHGKLVPQDPNDEPAIELLKRINPDFTPCDNGHYENLPGSWCLTDIKSIFTINPKNKVADDVIAGFVPMTNIADGYSNEFRFEPRLWGHIKKGFTHFAEGDIVVAKISPCLENRKSAIVTSLPNGIGAGTTELFVFRSQCVLPEYGLYFFKSDSFINHCAGTFNGVVGQQRVSKSIIESIKFPLPPLSEQKRIVDAVHTAFTKLDTIMESL